MNELDKAYETADMLKALEFARFDEDLWFLLQNKEWRLRLRDYIIEHKLTDDCCFEIMAAEGGGAIAALLIAV